MNDALRAEWLKLRSTRSPVACVLSVGVVTLLLALAVGVSTAQRGVDLPPDHALAGLLGYGLIIFMVLAALSVTTEFGTGTIRVTFTVYRSRPLVIVAKALMAAVVCAVTAVVLAPVALLLGYSAAGHAPPSYGAVARLLWGAPVVSAVAAVLAVGVATLIRRTAGAVAVVIIWPLVVEGLTTLVPTAGERVTTFLPFANAQLFLGDSQGLPFGWPPAVGLAIFAGYAALFVGLAIWAVDTRDV